MDEILAYSVKEKKKVPMVSDIEFRKSPNGSYMIKGKNADGGTLTTMMGAAKAQAFIDGGVTVVEKYSY